MSRSERRARTQSVVEKRAKNNYHWLRKDNSESWSLFFGKLKEGVHHQWLRTTGRVCSCDICKRPRYNKKDRKYVRT